MGYLQRARPLLEKPRFAAHNGSCGSRLQARSGTKGKPNYLLQEARNEEALALLDMNPSRLWCTCGWHSRVHSRVQWDIRGPVYGGKLGRKCASQFPARGHKSPSYTCHTPYLCRRQSVQTAKLFHLMPDLMLVEKH